MKIRSLKIKNFRGYKTEIKVCFENLTLIVGKNDIGKSTILEAADIFFGGRKADSNDLNIDCSEDDRIEISVEFSDFPETIDLDAGATTSLAGEYLVNSAGNLEIKKIFVPGSSAQPKVFLTSNMPVSAEVLITLKNADLKKKAKELKIDEETYNAGINNSIRKAIWACQTTSSFVDQEIEINKEDGKIIYEKLEQVFPIFTLFSVDRKNTDQDDEIQAPIKASIKELMSRLKEKLDPIKQEVIAELDKISTGTIEKLAEMNPEVARTLKSIAEKPAWEKAFSISIESDGVPLNKRGSGVKRLVLINYFRQEAERRRNQENKINVFYAIEEPETSQHPDWQIKLFNAFRELTAEDGFQIAITSHHPELCGLVNLDCIRFIQKTDDEVSIKEGNENNYHEISTTLGVLPKLDGVKVVVGVEGPHDVEFLKNIAGIFEVDGNNSKILWIPMGGGTLRDYVEKGYLDLLNLPQIHFFDRDSDQKYQHSISTLKEKGYWAELTELLTLENYIHPKHYNSVWPELADPFVDLSSVSWLSDWKDRNIPTELSSFIKLKADAGNSGLKKYNASNIKKHFAHVARKMTLHEFQEMNTHNELKKIFDEIKKHL